LGFTCPAGLPVGNRCIVFSFYPSCCNVIDVLIKTVIPTVDS